MFLVHLVHRIWNWSFFEGYSALDGSRGNSYLFYYCYCAAGWLNICLIYCLFSAGIAGCNAKRCNSGDGLWCGHLECGLHGRWDDDRETSLGRNQWGMYDSVTSLRKDTFEWEIEREIGVYCIGQKQYQQTLMRWWVWWHICECPKVYKIDLQRLTRQLTDYFYSFCYTLKLMLFTLINHELLLRW